MASSTTTVAPDKRSVTQSALQSKSLNVMAGAEAHHFFTS
jgi:hypothetical protein